MLSLISELESKQQRSEIEYSPLPATTGYVAPSVAFQPLFIEIDLETDGGASDQGIADNIDDDERELFPAINWEFPNVEEEEEEEEARVCLLPNVWMV